MSYSKSWHPLNTQNINFGDSFLVGILSAFSSYQTGILVLLIASLGGCLAVATLHFWSWLWNTQWDGVPLLLCKVLGFAAVFLSVLISMGVSHAQEYVAATARKLRSSLGDYSSEWRRLGMSDAYNEFQRRDTHQELPAPSAGGNKLELRNNDELRIFFDSLSRAASRAVANASMIPVSLVAKARDADAATSATRFPVTIGPDNSWATRALEIAVDGWVFEARAWCNEQLGVIRIFAIGAAAGVLILCMALCATLGWHNIDV